MSTLAKVISYSFFIQCICPVASYGQSQQSTPVQPVPMPKLTKEGRRIFSLAQEFRYCFDRDGIEIAVPKHYASDLASIPRNVRGFFPPDGEYFPAAIVHDWLYAIGDRNTSIEQRRTERAFADDVFEAAMLDYDVDYTTRNLIVSAVRTGGARGFGLEADYFFVDNNTGKQVPPPFEKSIAKSKSTSVNAGCVGFVPGAALVKLQERTRRQYSKNPLVRIGLLPIGR
jgi:Protein of unknown function (DUF1353)